MILPEQFRTRILILMNLEILRTTGKTIIIRMPVIPGFNDESEVEKVKDYCRERELPLELLNYHEMGEDKRRALEAADQAAVEEGLTSPELKIPVEEAHRALRPVVLSGKV